jgi:type II secretory ATPase GspE/PulE/Tfp pilus assembly ATPase PilB-like protein
MKPPEVGADGEPVIYLYRGKGCDKCGGSGYSGRVGIFEVLDVSEKISRMIMDNVSAEEIRDVAVEEGMLTMLQDGYLKALEGITTLEEVLRVSKE